MTMLSPALLHGTGDQLATFCQFGYFGNFLAFFLAHFDPWTICDNSVTHQNPSFG